MAGKKQPTPAYAYLRVSTSGQLAGYGPERQEELIRAFAERAGYSIAGVYQDAYTGTEADRPRFTEMLAAMMGNGVKTVIVESLDRLARDLFVQNLLLAKLSAESLTLVAANTGEDVTAAMAEDPMRRAMVQIQGVFAELDRNLTVAKLRRGRDAASKERGRRVEGPLPYGHDPDRPLEKATLEHMRALKAKRQTYAKIADALNAEPEKYPTRTGAKWNKQTVYQTLSRAKMTRKFVLDRAAGK
jgi:DNA invertase Pin-like site-specific DNA recombinase